MAEGMIDVGQLWPVGVILARQSAPSVRRWVTVEEPPSSSLFALALLVRLALLLGGGSAAGGGMAREHIDVFVRTRVVFAVFHADAVVAEAPFGAAVLDEQ